LLHKLSAIGVGGKLLTSIRSILSNRSQQVRVGKAVSNSHPVRSGVPQGSVIGPVLFILFINDITYSLPPTARTKLFADDLKSYISVTGDSCITNFSFLLDLISKWALKWQLPLSLPKCGWMHITNRAISRELSFNLAGHSLTKLFEIKDLGILYTSQLSFASHVSNICSKAKQRSYLLRKSFTSSCCEALILAFKTYVIPILEYCSSLWSPNQVSEILKIESVQRSFTRTLRCCRGLPYKDRLSICGLLTLEKRRLLADLVLFYKILHRHILTDLTDSLKLVVGPTRGHPLKIVYNGARINSRLHFFTVRTTKIWNSLPENIACAPSVDSFRRGLNSSSFDLSKFLILK